MHIYNIFWSYPTPNPSWTLSMPLFQTSSSLFLKIISHRVHTPCMYMGMRTSPRAWPWFFRMMTLPSEKSSAANSSYTYWHVNWLDLTQVLCRKSWLLWACDHTGHVGSKRYCFTELFPFSCSCNLFTLSSMICPEHWRKMCDADVNFRAEYFAVTYPLLFSYFWVTVWTIVHWGWGASLRLYYFMRIKISTWKALWYFV